jgi:hypothetical protein
MNPLIDQIVSCIVPNLIPEQAQPPWAWVNSGSDPVPAFYKMSLPRNSSNGIDYLLFYPESHFSF